MNNPTRTIAMFKNMKYGFEQPWEIDKREDGVVSCLSGDPEYVAISKPITITFDPVENEIEAQLDALDKMEQKVREDALLAMDRAISAIKDRRAALLSLGHDN